MTEPLEQVDVAILGGGPGGYVAALEAARRGASVVLIEKEKLGGTCLNVGCIPTKVLTTSAELLHRARGAAEFGLSIPHADIDLPGLMAFKQNTVDQLVAGVEQLLRARRVRIVRGTGRLARPGLLDVELGDGRRESIAASQVVLAPGSVAARPPIEGLDLPGVVFSTGALEIDRVPERFAVIGGGVIGMEFACIYEALGSRVTVLEAARTILPAGVDDDHRPASAIAAPASGDRYSSRDRCQSDRGHERRSPRRDPGPRRRLGCGGRPGTRRHRALAQHRKSRPGGVRVEPERPLHRRR